MHKTIIIETELAECLQTSNVGQKIFSTNNKTSKFDTILEYFKEQDSIYFNCLIEKCQKFGQQSMLLFVEETQYFEMLNLILVDKLYSHKILSNCIWNTDYLDEVNYHISRYKYSCQEEIKFTTEQDSNSLQEEINALNSITDIRLLPNYNQIHPLLVKRDIFYRNKIFAEVNKLKMITLSVIKNLNTWDFIALDEYDFNYRRLRLIVLNDAMKNARTTTPIITNQVIRDFYGYLNNTLQKLSSELILKEFENSGVVAISLVKDFQSFTERETKTIQVLKTLVENNKHLIVKKIVNPTIDSDHNIKSNNKDTDRKTCGISFNINSDDLNTSTANKILTSIWEDIIEFGIVDPKSEPCNGDGNWGVDLLNKDYGCEVQLKHFDFPQYLNKQYPFRSFRDSMSSEYKTQSYYDNEDGNVSIFVNPFGFADYLLRGDGSFIIIPPYSFIVLRGNVMHCGTGNYSHFEGIYKFFFYGDNPNYKRKGSNNQYRVFLPPGHEYHTVVRDILTDVVLKIVIIPPYICYRCGEGSRYTHPYCKRCLNSVWCFNLMYTRGDYVMLYTGDDMLCGSCFPNTIWGDVVTGSMYQVRHPELQGRKVLAIQLCNQEGVAIDKYLDCFVIRSFVASLSRTSNKMKANVELRFSSITNTIQLVCLQNVTNGDKVILFLNYNTFDNSEYRIDKEDHAILNAKSK